MQYKTMHRAVFLRRPNRFVAHCLLDGQEVVCHVKNTGRCRESLVPGAEVWLEESDNPTRKTRYSLISVQKGERLINMDSQAPNQAVWEAFTSGFQPDFLPGKPDQVRREVTFGNSRFDLCMTIQGKPFYLEVKGVTLEENGVVRFPDAPTQRGVKHVQELTRMRQEGMDTGIFFVVQMADVRYFTPNRATDPSFAQALIEAQAAGVKLVAWDCQVTPTEMTLGKEVPIYLTEKEKEKPL